MNIFSVVVFISIFLTVFGIAISVGSPKRLGPRPSGRQLSEQGERDSNVRFPEEDATPQDRFRDEQSPSYSSTIVDKDEDQPQDNSKLDEKNNVQFQILIHPRALDKIFYRIQESPDRFTITITQFVLDPHYADFESRFDDCVTSEGHAGRCSYLRACIRPKFLVNFEHFVNDVCYINGQHLGICCPDGDATHIHDHPHRDFVLSLVDGQGYNQPGRHHHGASHGHRPGHGRPSNHRPQHPHRPVRPVGHPRPQQPHRPTVAKPKPQPAHIDKPKPKPTPPPGGILNKDCGLNFKTRIIGGQQADPKDWLWMVALLRQNKDQFCGGALISEHYVVTAAHCVIGLDAPQLVVRLGEYDFGRTSSPDRQDHQVSVIKRHSSFNRTTNANDIALLKLKTPAVFTDLIRPICLPEPTVDFRGQQSTVAGWGTLSYGGKSSPVLRQVTVPIWSNAECEKALPGRILNVALCAGPKGGGKDSCQGDSGGPLMLENSARRWSIVGIVSWGIRCGEPNLPGVYTRVNKYLDWIVKNAQP